MLFSPRRSTGLPAIETMPFWCVHDVVRVESVLCYSVQECSSLRSKGVDSGARVKVHGYLCG